MVFQWICKLTAEGLHTWYIANSNRTTWPTSTQTDTHIMWLAWNGYIIYICVYIYRSGGLILIHLMYIHQFISVTYTRIVIGHLQFNRVNKWPSYMSIILRTSFVYDTLYFHMTSYQTRPCFNLQGFRLDIWRTVKQLNLVCLSPMTCLNVQKLNVQAVQTSVGQWNK